jgi:hypothetical protein
MFCEVASGFLIRSHWELIIKEMHNNGTAYLTVIQKLAYAECHNAECHNAECRYAECRYADCRVTQNLI